MRKRSTTGEKGFLRGAVLFLGLALVLSCLSVGNSGGSPSNPAVETDIASQMMTLQALQTQKAALANPTETPPPAELVLEIQTSLETFYCYQEPSELTITVTVGDMDRGMSVHYHIEDKTSGVTSEEQRLELQPASANTRSATIIGGFSEKQNLQFPPLMSESYFVYQIVGSDGAILSPEYRNITFFPCAQ